VLLSVPDYERSGRRIHVINPCVGGSGGRPMGDGFDGVDFTLGFMRNTPAEILESETFIMVREFAFVPDSGGPGQYRGGLGIALEFQVFAPDATVVARGMDRTRFHPWGVHGGHPGARMRPALLYAGSEREQSIRKINFLKLNPGDRVRLATSGGGGYGNPLLRDIERVRADVELGFVSRLAAQHDYGVVFDATGALDEAKTVAERKLRLSTQLEIPIPSFNLGKDRDEYEATWSADARAAFQEILGKLPILVRYRIKNELHNRLLGEQRLNPITRQEVLLRWNELRARLYPDRYLASQFIPKAIELAHSQQVRATS
jgi:N-methylhydantoinase B